MRTISLAMIAMSLAVPPAPPDGWCSMKRVFGSDRRFSRLAAA